MCRSQQSSEEGVFESLDLELQAVETAMCELGAKLNSGVLGLGGGSRYFWLLSLLSILRSTPPGGESLVVLFLQQNGISLRFTSKQ